MPSEDALLHPFGLNFIRRQHKRDVNDTRAEPNASGFAEFNCSIKCLVGLCLSETKKKSIVVLQKGFFSSDLFKEDDFKQKKHYPILELTASKAH